jgi:ferredoxin
MFGALVNFAAGIVLAMAVYALWRRTRIWRLGSSVDNLEPWSERLKAFSKYLLDDVLLHRKLIRHEHYPGVMHLFIFWGFLILLVATVLTGLEFYASRHLGWTMPTVSYVVQTGFMWDAGGLLATVGLVMAAYRRYVIRPSRIPTKFNAGVVIALLLLLILTGYLVEGMRIGATELNSSSALYNPEDSVWSPIGWGVAKMLIWFGGTPAVLETLHLVFWWIHAIMFLSGFAYMAVRFGRLTHIVISPLHILLRQRDLPVTPEDAASFESERIADLPDMTWRQLLSLDACTNCGRCEDQCPVRADGSSLSPRRVVQHMKRFMLERAPVLLGTSEGEVPPPPKRTTIESIGGESALMSCTMCAACVAICPVSINQMALIAGVRSGLSSGS